jgi:hypothetical protein
MELLAEFPAAESECPNSILPRHKMTSPKITPRYATKSIALRDVITRDNLRIVEHHAVRFMRRSSAV